MLRLYGGNTFALSSPLYLVSWITLRLSFPLAVSIDIWLLLFIKRWKKTVEGSINFYWGNAQFKKMRTCSKRQYTNSQIILNKKKIYTETQPG